MKDVLEKQIAKDVFYVGVYDSELDLFESQYPVPQGVTYNSYILLDEKTVLFDSVDKRKTSEWLENVECVLGNRTLDFMVISHMEPDHSGSIIAILEKHPEMKLIVNAKTVIMLKNFIEKDLCEKLVIVKDGEQFSVGEHTLKFVFAPMVHWPEVMVTLDTTTNTLFSADAFGRFGGFAKQDDWEIEARRYYFNIVGKYGIPVQTLIKKLACEKIERICPLHGEILQGDLSRYIEKYLLWSSYQSEKKGVAIFVASIHGNTLAAAKIFEKMLQEKGVETKLFDLTRCDYSYALSAAFEFDRAVFASSTYNAQMFSPMSDFLERLEGKGYQCKKVGIIENGSWAPFSAKAICARLEKFKNISHCAKVVTIMSAVKSCDLKNLEELASELV